MRSILFIGQTEDEMATWLARDDATVLAAERSDGGLSGFAEVGTRSYAAECEVCPVAYLEGWFVDADNRGRGIGAALVHAVEDWALARGHRELASDTHVTNRVSQQAHERLGFTEVDRAVLYLKQLNPSDRP